MILNFMLIDDNKIDLFINQKIIEKAKIHSIIKTFSSAVSAIDYLKSLKSLKNKTSSSIDNVPDIIFLDINMPEMDGFQFISEFNKLMIKKKQPIKIYMLSSSNYYDDVQKVKKEKTCNGYINKPLTRAVLEKILAEFKSH